MAIREILLPRLSFASKLAGARLARSRKAYTGHLSPLSDQLQSPLAPGREPTCTWIPCGLHRLQPVQSDRNPRKRRFPPWDAASRARVPAARQSDRTHVNVGFRPGGAASPWVRVPAAGSRVRGQVSCKRGVRGHPPRSDSGRARRNPGRSRPRTHWVCRIQRR
jgi:hypothetical protein